MSVPNLGRPRVVLDINVYLDFARGGAGNLLLPAPDDLPTNSPSTDVLALAFEERMRLFASPHIFRNINRVLTQDGHSDSTRRRFIEFIADVCDTSGGAIVDPIVLDYAIGDHEDNNILALAKDPAVDADVVVSSDQHLIDLGPAWNGRLMMRPRQFVAQVLRSAKPQPQHPVPERAAVPVHTPAAAPVPVPAPAPKSVPARFPELRGVQLDRHGIGSAEPVPVQGDDRQL